MATGLFGVYPRFFTEKKKALFKPDFRAFSSEKPTFLFFGRFFLDSWTNKNPSFVHEFGGFFSIFFFCSERPNFLPDFHFSSVSLPEKPCFLQNCLWFVGQNPPKTSMLVTAKLNAAEIIARLFPKSPFMLKYF